MEHVSEAHSTTVPRGVNGGRNRRLPVVAAFPQALGTGILVRSDRPVTEAVTELLRSLIDGYESVLSRFRTDSTLSAMARAEHGGTFEFPRWAGPLFDLADALDEATEGAVDPCVGEDLIRLGYGADLTFRVDADASERLGALHGRPTWRRDIGRDGSTLRTRGPVHLDFGCCGKGHVVDLLVRAIADAEDADASGRTLLVDAGGDIRTSFPLPWGAAAQGGPGTDRPHTCGTTPSSCVESPVPAPVIVALEDPWDESRAIGTAELPSGSLCASAPSRRHWTDAAHHRLHHILNAISGLPVDDVAATWTVVTDGHCPVPTATADGLATALFATDPQRLFDRWSTAMDKSVPFSCLVLRTDGHAVLGGDFPGRLFVRKTV